MSHTITVPYTVPAGGVTANLFSNTSIEYFGGAAVLTMYGSADAAGDTMSFMSFGVPTPLQYVVDPSPIDVASTPGAVKANENFIGQFPIPAGHRCELKVRGTVGHIGRFHVVIGAVIG